MIKLTPDERRLRAFLANRAATVSPDGDPEAATIRYRPLGAELDPEGKLGWRWEDDFRVRNLAGALHHVNAYEAEHGRPLLGALVIRKNEQVPGGGFGWSARTLRRLEGDSTEEEFACWRSELEAAVRYWPFAGPLAVIDVEDARHDMMMAELAAIRKTARRLVHEQ